jgi:hypothetical protein
VIDIPAAALAKGVAVSDAAITGVVADGAVLAFTLARFAGQDDLDRPLLENDYVRIDLDAGRVTAPVRVPGYVVAASGADLFTVEDIWGEDWSVTSNVVAVRMDSGAAEVLDRLALPAGAYDLRAVGATLFFSTGGDLIVPMPDALGRPDQWLPESRIGTRLVRWRRRGDRRRRRVPHPAAAREATLISRRLDRRALTSVAAELSAEKILPAIPCAPMPTP